MASRKSTKPSSLQPALASSKSSTSGTVKANDSGTTNKLNVKSSVTIVKSRYLQTDQKTSFSKSNSSTKESIIITPRPSSPKPSIVKLRMGTVPKCSLVTQALPSSMSNQEPSILQSTLNESVYIRPDLDISVIKDQTMTAIKGKPEGNPENEKRDIEMQTFLLAYLTAKMESNTAKLNAEAEAKTQEMMEVEQRLYADVQEKKRQYLLLEKDRQMNELLDIQIAALTPLVATAQQFTKEYQCLATAIDATRHELPVKNFYIKGDRRDFLDQAQLYLQEIEKLLSDVTRGEEDDNQSSLELLKDMKKSSSDISKQLLGTSSELQELLPLVCRHRIQTQLALEEDQMGDKLLQDLYCHKLLMDTPCDSFF